MPTKVGTYQMQISAGARRGNLQPALVGANLGWHNRSHRDAANIVPTKVGTYQKRAATAQVLPGELNGGRTRSRWKK